RPSSRLAKAPTTAMVVANERRGWRTKSRARAALRKPHPSRPRQPAATPRMPEFDLPRRLAAEALGTALLVATVVGSGIMAESLTKDVALALLGNTLPTGAILVVLITILGPI